MKKIRKMLLQVLSLLLVILTFVACSSKGETKGTIDSSKYSAEIKKIIEKGVLKVGVKNAVVGFGYQDPLSKEYKGWIYVNILDTIFFVFYEYFFSNSIGLKYPNLL